MITISNSVDFIPSVINIKIVVFEHITQIEFPDQRILQRIVQTDKRILAQTGCKTGTETL